MMANALIWRCINVIRLFQLKVHIANNNSISSLTQKEQTNFDLEKALKRINQAMALMIGG